MGKLEDEAPSTIKEVGIHISYLRRDISSLTQLVKEMPNGFATKEELLSVDNRVKKLEDDRGSFWVRFGIPTMSALAGAVLVVLVLSYINRLK